jgi:hypothetical protein
MVEVMTWVGPVLDVAAVVLLALVLWRLGRDPGTAWAEREARLRTIFDELRALVAQSEGLARDLDAKLAARESRLATLLGAAERALSDRDVTASMPIGAASVARAGAANAPSAGPANAWSTGPAIPPSTAPATSASTALPPEADPAATAQRIEVLADAGIAIEEIARRVGVAPAEVRLVIGLKAARIARQRVAGGGDDARA